MVFKIPITRSIVISTNKLYHFLPVKELSLLEKNRKSLDDDDDDDDDDDEKGNFC